MIVQEPIQAAIWHCLNHYAYNDAVFLSERLYAEVKSDETLYLLATSYFRSGLKNHTYAILKNQHAASPQCRYLFACCALELNKFSEAEMALTGNDSQQKNLDDLVKEFGDQASFALQLLAKICMKTECKTRATDAFKKSLKINPFLWTCFVDLCNKGEKPDANRIFQLNSLDTLVACHGGNISLSVESFVATPVAQNNQNITPEQPINHITPSQNSVLQSSVNTSKLCTPDDSPLTNSLPMSGITCLAPTRPKPIRYRSLLGNASSISPFTPSFGIINWDNSIPDSYSTPVGLDSQPTLTEANDQKSIAKRMRALINRKESPFQISKPVFSQSSNTISTPTSPTSLTSLATQNVRRSSRIFSHSYSVKENNKSPNRSKFVTPKSPSRKSNKRLAKTNLNKNVYSELNARNREKERSETITSAQSKTTNSAISNNTNNVNNNYNNMQHTVILQKQCAEGLMLLMRTLGQAYSYLSQFECNKAIECLSAVSPQQYNTSWVQCLLGLAYFEMADYERSAEYFSEVHKREPHRTQYMEIYSTALWHMQKEVALSALAQDLVKLDKHSPVTWCVAGNCFSLHKEHDTAIKFFQRSVQVDPTFTYAYTLLGHEYVVTEELDKAMSSFRLAISLDYRHYNAWFGLGTIYSKQERYHLAEINYLRALSINTHSSVLMCHIGVVQHALKQSEKALQTLNAAIVNDPKNPLCKFHRGQVYFNLGRHTEALKELEELKEIVPKESLVYYLIGKVHKKLGNTDLALMHFSWATDLDPKGASSQIKEAFDPSVGRTHTDDESPQSPSAEDFPSESNSVPPQETTQEEIAFNGLPEDSDSDIL